MHLSLDDFNLLISQKADPAERARMMDHILECEMCATRFRMLNELDQRMDKDLHAGQRHRNPFARMPLKYALGAAAVLAMAIYPYFTNPDEVTEPKSTTEMASLTTLILLNRNTGPACLESIF